jgi:asparagine synthase (glutamine-hydrolysing)
MPGIVGIISQRPVRECQDLVEAMVASMKHESFYVSGTYAVPEMGVYGGWVADQESFAAKQVFTNERRDISLLFSGECFSDSEGGTNANQADRADKGIQSQRLIRLYEKEGEVFVQQLNGLFSGFLIDKRQRKSLLFNDRYGVERVYWHQSRDGIYFASEAKALLRILPKLRRFNAAGVGDFITFGCTLDSRTLFDGVSLLPGASLWRFDELECRRQKYFSVEEWESLPALPVASFEGAFQETFQKILPRYFRSESKIGISLTAGLDSRMILAGRPETAQRPACYTFSGGAENTLDIRLAARVAHACGLDHHILRLGYDFFSDFASHADRTIYITDGCLGALGAHEIYLNQLARELGPVRLTGNYGGEILRGVSTFKPLGLSPGLLQPDFVQSQLTRVGLDRNAQCETAFAAFDEIPRKRFGVLAAGRSQSIFRTPYLDNDLVSLAIRASNRVVRSASFALSFVKQHNPNLARIPTDMGHADGEPAVANWLRRLLCRFTFKLEYFYGEGLPRRFSRFNSVFARVHSRLGISGLHKFLHYRSWFRNELADYVSDVISDRRARQLEFLNPNFLQMMVKEHIAGRVNFVREIDAVLTLEAVERLLFRDLPKGLECEKESQPATS